MTRRRTRPLPGVYASISSRRIVVVSYSRSLRHTCLLDAMLRSYSFAEYFFNFPIRIQCDLPTSLATSSMNCWSSTNISRWSDEYHCRFDVRYFRETIDSQWFWSSDGQILDSTFKWSLMLLVIENGLAGRAARLGTSCVVEVVKRDKRSLYTLALHRSMLQKLFAYGRECHKNLFTHCLPLPSRSSPSPENMGWSATIATLCFLRRAACRVVTIV